MFSTLYQYKLFLVMFAIGFGLCIVCSLFTAIKFLIKKNVVHIMLDLLNGLVIFAVYYMFNLWLNMGVFRIYLAIGMIAGYIVSKLTIGKLFAKIFYLIYTKLYKLVIALGNTSLGKRVLK